MKANRLLSLVALATALGISNTTQAAELATNYPTQVVKIVVPYTPGGITDLLGRALSLMNPYSAATFVSVGRLVSV